MKLKKSNLKSVLQLARSYTGVGGRFFSLRLPPRDKIGWLETRLKAARMMKDQAAEDVRLGNLGLAYANLTRHARQSSITSEHWPYSKRSEIKEMKANASAI